MSADKLRLTVAHNSDTELVPRLAEFNSVESVFGKMPNDLMGGGRNRFVLKELNLKQLRRLVDQAHQHNIQFNYLLNTTCMSNREVTRSFNDRLYAFIGTLVDMGVDAFVIAMPYMLDLIKRHYPSIKVSVSTFAIINSIKKAKVWEDKGADRIIVQQDSNRDFSLLAKIRESVSCEIELFANSMCVDQCPYAPFHAAFNSHGSASVDPNKGFGLDYCACNCALRRLENPVEFLRGRFIRPEDTPLYQEVGVDLFKLSDRMKSTDWLVRAAGAFHAKRYDGNLVDLISYPYLRGDDDAMMTNPTPWLLRPEFVNLRAIQEVAAIGAGETMVYIDNRKLDGFVQHFTKHNCKETRCGEECTYCNRYAAEAVTMDAEKAALRISHHKQLINMMVDRTAFSHEPLLKRVFVAAARTALSVQKLRKPR